VPVAVAVAAVAVAAVIDVAAATIVPLSAPVGNAARLDAATDPPRLLKRFEAMGKAVATGFSVAAGLLAQHRDSTIV